MKYPCSTLLCGGGAIVFGLVACLVKSTSSTQCTNPASPLIASAPTCRASIQLTSRKSEKREHITLSGSTTIAASVTTMSTHDRTHRSALCSNTLDYRIETLGRCRRPEDSIKGDTTVPAADRLISTSSADSLYKQREHEVQRRRKVEAPGRNSCSSGFHARPQRYAVSSLDKRHGTSNAPLYRLRGGGPNDNNLKNSTPPNLAVISVRRPSITNRGYPILKNLAPVLAAIVCGIAYMFLPGGGMGRLGMSELALLGTGLLAVLLHCVTNVFSDTKSPMDVGARHPDFRSFRKLYLGVHLLCAFGDALPAAYLYQTYESRGLSIQTISRLFIVSQVSVLVSALFVGAGVDRLGRKKGCMAYSILQAIQCVLVRSTDKIELLVLGRALSGVAVCLLYSSFECWMVSEHTHRGFSPSLLPAIFTPFVIGSGVLAVLAGLVSGQVVKHGYGLAAPFDLSVIVALAATALMGWLWTENYGTPQTSTSSSTPAPGRGGGSPPRGGASLIEDAALSESSLVASVDWRVPLFGVFQAMYDAAFATWIFIYVPSLTKSDGGEELNLGIVFGSLMLAVSSGSYLPKIINKCTDIDTEGALTWVAAITGLIFAASSMELPCSKMLTSFLLLEVMIGAYYSSIGPMRARLLKDENRGTIMGIFRSAGTLLSIVATYFTIQQPWDWEERRQAAFLTCAVLCGVSATAMHVLNQYRDSSYPDATQDPKGSKARHKRAGNSSTSSSASGSSSTGSAGDGASYNNNIDHPER